MNEPTYLPTTPATRIEIGPEGTTFIEADGTRHVVFLDEQDPPVPEGLEDSISRHPAKGEPSG